jgi:hypothetical protein
MGISSGNANDRCTFILIRALPTLTPAYRFTSPVQFTMTVMGGLSASSSKFARRQG